jgi:hypothetical protein
MTQTRIRSWALGGMTAVFALAGCGGDQSSSETSSTTQTAGGVAPAAQPAPTPPPQPAQEMRLEIDVATRKVHVYRREQLEKSYGIAVGRREWPTQNGEWNVTQVVWNPGWTPPPDESWSKDEEPKEPGDPDNPLGTVQIVYDPPRTIHGTNQPETIGQAASHGSIRMRNAEAEELAQMVMEAGGAAKDPAWIQNARSNRKVRQEVQLPNPIPIRVINGADNADAVEGERSDSASTGSGGASSRGSARSDSTSRSSRSDSTSRRSRSSRSDTTRAAADSAQR